MHVIEVAAAAAEHAGRLQDLFDAASCPCHCRYWHFEGSKNEWLARCAEEPQRSAAEHANALAAGELEGLVAWEASDAAQVVGWMKLTRRARVPKLTRLPVYRALPPGDDDATFSIGCLLVRPGWRRRGVARALVRSAAAIASDRGAHALEAYPRRSTEPLHDEEAWQGPERLFLEAGFVAIHDVGPYPVYQLRLA